jgi:hypothetical protein
VVEFLHLIRAMPASDATRASRKRLTQAVTAGFAQQLATTCHAKEVSLYMRTHRLPSPAEILGGMRLSDEALYKEESLGTFPGGAP